MKLQHHQEILGYSSPSHDEPWASRSLSICCDASERAWGLFACWRAERTEGEVEVGFLTACLPSEKPLCMTERCPRCIPRCRYPSHLQLLLNFGAPAHVKRTADRDSCTATVMVVEPSWWWSPGSQEHHSIISVTAIQSQVRTGEVMSNNKHYTWLFPLIQRVRQALGVNSSRLRHIWSISWSGHWCTKWIISDECVFCIHFNESQTKVTRLHVLLLWACCHVMIAPHRPQIPTLLKKWIIKIATVIT